MTPKRLSVKIFARNPEVTDISAFTAVLQRWIQQHTVPGLLIDVVDYKHMHDGPGIVLIGDEGDYAYDLRDGKPGVMFTLKRYEETTLPGVLQNAFRAVVSAAVALETEDSLNGLRFDFNAIKVEFLDRLNTPNRPETWTALETSGELAAFVTSRYDEAAKIELAHDDPREVFALLVTTENALTGETLVERVSVSTVEV